MLSSLMDIILTRDGSGSYFGKLRVVGPWCLDGASSVKHTWMEGMCGTATYEFIDMETTGVHDMKLGITPKFSGHLTAFVRAMSTLMYWEIA